MDINQNVERAKTAIKDLSIFELGEVLEYIDNVLKTMLDE